jgi:WbqC-like protein
MNLIVDLQYFPSIILYKNLYKFSNIVFEQYEHYQKMSFRNRCQIAGAEGVIDLSIPLVKGRDQKSLLRDVKISDRGRWQDQHWKTILSCYSRSPWFEFYRDGLAELYGKPFAFLMDWNLACFEWSLGMLQMPVQFALTESWQKSYDGNEWMDWRGKILPKDTGKLGGPAGKPGHILSPDPVAAPSSGMVASPDSLKYRQVFEERTGFLPGLSILDLLFCEGKRAKSLLIGALPGADLARSPDQM